jgi:glycosyltransferase involved in cell wall biosynthesis
MRIGLLTDIYKPALNGITNFVSLHKRELERRGHDVWVVTPGYTDYEDDEPHILRVKAVPVSDTGYYLNVGYDGKTRRLLREMDILHAQNFLVSGLHATTLGRHMHKPVVYTSHTRYDLVLQQYLPMPLSSLADSFLETAFSVFTQHCDLTVAPTRGMQERLRSWGTRCRIEVIPNGIDVEAFSHPKTVRSRSELGIPPDARVITFTGRMDVEKNIPFLLRAFRRVAERVPDAYLLMVGGGAAIEEYRELAEDLGIAPRTRFTGWVPYADIPSYLPLADFFATASLTEVHPLTVLEAMAAGLPVVGLRTAGIIDVVEDGSSGLLAAEDRSALAAAMQRLCEDDGLRMSLAAGARATGQRYAIANTTERYLQFYEELVERGAQARVRGGESRLKRAFLLPDSFPDR